MSEPQDKTVGPVPPPPHEVSLARLKTSLESARSPAAAELARFLAERIARGSAETGRSPVEMPKTAYEMGRLLAKGGMGQILSARDNSIQRTVAVKVILTGADASDEHIHRLVTEARITGQLEHPNIVPLHELGVTPDGVVYYTMRLVEGVTLCEVLETIRQKDKRAVAKYPLGTLLTVFQKVCDAVAFAHSRGVMHRDLKPDNIMLGEFGEVFVMDWGLAKRIRGGEPEAGTAPLNRKEMAALGADSFKTLSGEVKGTPRYMAPEQAEGRVEDIDERTDIYALGAILYTILTLHPPITGDTVNEVLTRVASGDISPPTSYNPKQTRISRIAATNPTVEDIAPPELAHCPDRRIPSALSAVAMKALTRDKSKRYQTVAALQQDIAAYQGGLATSAEGASAMRLMLLLVRRHRTEFFLIIISLALMVGLATHFTRKIALTLAELRETAPTFYFEAKTLVDELKFAKALAKINYAISLQPENAQYYALKGNILQSMLQLAEARDAYARALELDPEHELPYVEFNLTLSERLLANSLVNGSIGPQGLNDLRVSMAHQLRTAEALALATRDSPDAKTAFESWRAVVNKIGLQGSLRREASGLALSVQQPEFNDLSPFRTAPLTKLHIAGTQVDDLTPVRNMPLVQLDISGTRVTDLTALKGMPLTRLDAARLRATNFNALAGLKLTSLNLAHTRISTLSPLRNAPLHFLQLEGCTNLTDFSDLAGFKQLEGITLPAGVRNLDPIRQLPRLKHIGYSLPEGGWAQVPAAEDFWRLQSPPPPPGK